MKGKIPELVMPAGSMPALRAAVLNGTDSVYFGAKRLNARVPAKNFDDAEIRDAIDFCHLHGKKAYLALNTLVKDSELEHALGLAANAYSLGADAVIVQDLGLMHALKELLPDFRMHASTQATCHSAMGAKFLKRMGAKRIVLARELSLGEIRAISGNSGAELECFVHGAMCFAYSGQCLFSSFAFNKSGNRGMCLQPCRLRYSWKGSPEKKFLLSMKDMCAVPSVKEIADAGVSAFKVEGRLKGVEYVSSVARVYRKAIDNSFGNGNPPAPWEIKELKIAFLREHNRGYFFGEKGRVFPETPCQMGVPAAELLGFEGGMAKLRLMENLEQWDRLSVARGDSLEEFTVKKLFRGKSEITKAFSGTVALAEFGKRPYLAKGDILGITSSRRLKDRAYASIGSWRKVKYSLKVAAQAGGLLEARVEFPGHKITILSEFSPKESIKEETGAEMVRGKLMKSSDFLEPGNFEYLPKGSPFIPLSELKKFKNLILDGMREELFSKYRRPVNRAAISGRLKKMMSPSCGGKTTHPQKTAVLAESVETARKLSKNIGFAAAYPSGKDSMEGLMLRVPPVQGDADIAALAREIKGAKGVICSNLGALEAALSAKAVFWAGPELNVFNSLSARLMFSLGAEAVIPSAECSLAQAAAMPNRNAVAPLVFFYPRLMVSAAYSGEKKPGEYVLIDRKGMEYRAVVRESGLLEIFNPVPVDMLQELPLFRDFGILCVDLSGCEERAGEAMGRLRTALLGKTPEKKYAKFTRGRWLKEVP